jgi:tryptophan 2,3-dioxygenase
VEGGDAADAAGCQHAGIAYFHVIAEVSSDDPGALRVVLREMVRGDVRERPGGFHVEGDVQGSDPRDANRSLLSALRQAERRSQLRAEWVDGDLVHRFVDYLPKGTRPASQTPSLPEENEDRLDPVLEGDGRSDYERYLRTDELLTLQKSPETWVHRDELLFQVTHQSSELWLKLAASEISEATDRIDRGNRAAGRRLLQRAVLAVEYVTEQLGMLEQLSPWEYREVRAALGHGSGFDSPGFAAVRERLPALEQAFERQLEREGIDLATLYMEAFDHEPLYQLAEELVTLDARLQVWRMRHFRVVTRIIGDDVVGTQGTPVEVLGRLIRVVAFPKLWEVRNTLTDRTRPPGD